MLTDYVKVNGLGEGYGFGRIAPFVLRIFRMKEM